MQPSLKILHLEDSLQDAELISEKLSESSFHPIITRVDNKTDFSSALTSQIYDLILADRTTPTFDGLSALKLTRELSPETPFIFVSGTLDEETAIETLTNGATDYVLKHRLSRLLPAVNRALTEIENEKKQHLLEKQFREAQKMEELGRLAGGIAHDFNNILAIIQCNNVFLASKDIPDDDRSRLSNTVKEAVERGAELVKQLLTFAKKNEPHSLSININKMIDGLVAMLQSTFPKGISFQKNLSANIPQLVGDPSQIHQILLNLCVNARDAMPEGGTISISTKVVPQNELYKIYPRSSNKDHIEITVSDTGSGMDDETLQHIFDPFFTTKSQGKGTGLGLSVVYGVVQSHHGMIQVESKKNRGTCFYIYLPVYDPPASSTPEDANPAQNNDLRGNETILLVEDEIALSNMLKRILNDKGYTVLTADNGLEGLRVFAQNSDKIDLVLTDSGLPGLSGLQMFLKLKEMRDNVKIVLTTGFLEPEEKSRMDKAGIHHYILKPFNISDLLLKIKQAIREKVAC